MIKLFKKKRYYFSDDSVAADTVVAFVLAVLSALIEISSVVVTMATRGNVPPVYGILYICAIIMSLMGIIFGRLSYKAEEGGMKSKRTSVIMNLFTLLFAALILILGLR